VGIYTQLFTPEHLAQLSPEQRRILGCHEEGDAMTNVDRALLNTLTTQLCDALDAMTDALREVRDELRALQDAPEPLRPPKEYVLVPPPPLPGPSL